MSKICEFVTEEQILGGIDVGMNNTTRICKIIECADASRIDESCLKFVSS